jgi:hypothetical protein
VEGEAATMTLNRVETSAARPERWAMRRLTPADSHRSMLVSNLLEKEGKASLGR